MAERMWSGMAAVMRVLTPPGATQLTAMLKRAHSSASVRVSPITPAFEAE